MKKYSTQFYGGKNSRREKKRLGDQSWFRHSLTGSRASTQTHLQFLCFISYALTHTYTHTEESVLKSSLRPFTRINSEKHLSIISSHCLISHTHTLFITHTELIAEPRGDKLERERCVRNPHLSPPELLT